VTSRSLTAAGLVVILVLSACTGGSQQSSQSTSSSTSGAAPVATTAPPSPTTAPPSPTTAPTPTEAPQPTAAPTNTASTQQQATGPSVTQGDIKAMAQAWANIKSYRVTAESNDPASPATLIMEIVRPDRAHTKISAGGKSFETVVIGKDVFVNLTGKWTKTTMDSAPQVDLFGSPQATEERIDKTIQEGDSLTKGALSTVDGQPCQEWNYQSKDGKDSVTVCVGLANNLPLQIKTSNPKGTMKFSDWNAPITIEPPI
jgi:hypothetical protein